MQLKHELEKGDDLYISGVKAINSLILSSNLYKKLIVLN